MPTTIDQLESLNRQRESLLARGEIASLQREIPQLERWASGMELSTRLADPLTEEVGRWIGNDPSFADPSYYGNRVTPIDRVGDRASGQDRLLFNSEMDLARIRGFARNLVNEVAPAIAVLRNLVNYVIGTSWQYGAEPIEKSSSSDPLVAAVDVFIQDWLKFNRWVGKRDREAYRRTVRDGEALPVLSSVGDGMTSVRFNEPSWITEPARVRDLDEWLHDKLNLSDVPLSWSFGVVTPASDVETVLGYHIVRDSIGNDWDFIPASRAVHMKAVTDSNVKRGVSEFHPVHHLIRSGEKVFDRAATGAIFHASLVGVKNAPPGTSESQISGISRVSTRTDPIPGGTRQLDQMKIGAATVLTMSSGLEWMHGSMGMQRTPIILLAGQASLRLAGTRWNMPEWMISGDASNNNFSSSLVAESPFVKSAESEQYAFSCDVEELLWKALKIAWAAGYFRRLDVDWETIVQTVKLVITPTPIATRDPEKETDRRIKLVDTGIMSRQTAAEQEELDWDDEKERMQDGITSMVGAGEGAGFGLEDM